MPGDFIGRMGRIGLMGPINPQRMGPINPQQNRRIAETQIAGIASENRTEDRGPEDRAAEDSETESHEDDWGNYSNSHNTRKPMP